jgi:hypothetical protein
MVVLLVEGGSRSSSPFSRTMAVWLYPEPLRVRGEAAADALGLEAELL